MPTSPLFYVIAAVVAVVIGVVCFLAGSAFRRKADSTTVGSAEDEARKILSDALKNAEAKKKEMLIEAKDEIHRQRSEADKDIRERRSEVQRLEHRLQQKEENLDRKTDNLEAKEEKIAKRAKEVEDKLVEVEHLK